MTEQEHAEELLRQSLLVGRKAKCSYYPNGGKYGKCQEIQDSTRPLPFFSYLGPGSDHYSITCKICQKSKNNGNHKVGESGHHEFVGNYKEFDDYYCGCWGWD